ncbi:MAG: hypothetical protein LBR17_05240 [Bacteroidales bacterium]|jgi:hypothetical protein|nr:hypothetical protein [Bacteroidales bacterium]
MIGISLGVSFAQTQIISKVQSVQGVTHELYSTQKVVMENPTTTIAFSHNFATGNPCTFYRIDSNNVTTDVVILDTAFEVKDMVILNNYLYFCGNFKNTTGFIAKANINDLFYNTLQFEYDKIPISISIDKIEAYIYNNATQIVAIGTDTNVTQPYHPMQFLLHSNEALGWFYRIYYSNDPAERMDDLELTNHYVVTVGKKYTEAGDFIVRRYDKTNIPINNGTIQPFTENAIDNFHCKATQGDDIGIAGTTFDANANTKTLCLVFDVVGLTINQSQYINGYQNQNIIIRDMAYDPSDNHILLIEQTPSLQYPIYEYAVVDWDIYNIPSLVKMYYSIPNTNDSLSGICVLDSSNQRFAVVGANIPDAEFFIWYGDRNTINGDCNIPENEQTQPFSLNSGKLPTSQSTPQININWDTQNVIKTILPIPIICN